MGEASPNHPPFPHILYGTLPRYGIIIYLYACPALQVLFGFNLREISNYPCSSIVGVIESMAVFQAMFICCARICNPYVFARFWWRGSAGMPAGLKVGDKV